MRTNKAANSSKKVVKGETEKAPAKKQSFHLEFLNQSQKIAWATFDQHDVLFMMGCAGTGKTFLATAFAITEILAKRKRKIVISRPVVEAGENLGFLPGDLNEKIAPYMLPIYDCIEKCVGRDNPQRDLIDRSLEVAPIAYLRGRTFDNSVCILDEAQNATKSQLKLFLTRFGVNSKVIITGDPLQSDLYADEVALPQVVKRLEGVPGIGVVTFKANAIVRHPLIGAILDKLER